MRRRRERHQRPDERRRRLTSSARTTSASPSARSERAPSSSGSRASYIDAVDPYWMPRATLGVDIPTLGRLRGDFQVSDPGERASSSAWLARRRWPSAFNGSSGCDGARRRQRCSATASATTQDSGALEPRRSTWPFRGFREPVGVRSRRATRVRIRIENTPEHARARRAACARSGRSPTDEPSAALVVLELRTAPAESLARVAGAARRHRPTCARTARRCSATSRTPTARRSTSARRRTASSSTRRAAFASPAFAPRYFYFKSLLDKLGIRADFVRIGEHKSAPEMFTRDGATRRVARRQDRPLAADRAQFRARASRRGRTHRAADAARAHRQGAVHRGRGEARRGSSTASRSTTSSRRKRRQARRLRRSALVDDDDARRARAAGLRHVAARRHRLRRRRHGRRPQPDAFRSSA